jgi:hypothetical protein
MAKTKNETVQPKPSMVVVMRMASRVSRLPKEMRAGYIERAKKRHGSKHPRVNDAAILAAVGHHG